MRRDLRRHERPRAADAPVIEGEPARRLPFAFVVASGVALAVACGGSTTPDTGAPDGTGDGGSRADGAVTTDGGSRSDGNARPDGADPSGGVCKVDAECNDDVGMSALAGSCFEGLCVCAPGFTVQTSGKCGKTRAPNCSVQSGKCQQGAAPCPEGTYSGNGETNMSCGDFAPASCCIPAQTCKGPAQPMICCAPNDAVHQPICVNGWLTCQSGDTPSIGVKASCG